MEKKSKQNEQEKGGAPQGKKDKSFK